MDIVTIATQLVADCGGNPCGPIAAGTTTLFSKTYGNKSGREPITCTGAVGDGLTLEARLVIVN